MSIDSKKIEISVNYRETSKNLIAEQNPRASMEQKTFNPISSTLQIEIKRLRIELTPCSPLYLTTLRVFRTQRWRKKTDVFETFERALRNIFFFSMKC